MKVDWSLVERWILTGVTVIYGGLFVYGFLEVGAEPRNVFFWVSMFFGLVLVVGIVVVWWCAGGEE